MSLPPIKYVTDTTPAPAGYCPACWAARRVIPFRLGGGPCWVCVAIKPKEPAPIEIEAPPAQATMEFDVP